MEARLSSINTRKTANGTKPYAGGPGKNKPKQRAPILSCNICKLRRGNVCSISGRATIDQYQADPPDCPDPDGSHFTPITVRKIQVQDLPASKSVVTYGPVPFDQWPSRLGGFRGLLLPDIKKLVEFAAPPDTGVGDTIARNLGVKGEIFKATLRATGIDCGCDAKKIEYNQKYPYDGCDGRPLVSATPASNAPTLPRDG